MNNLINSNVTYDAIINHTVDQIYASLSDSFSATEYGSYAANTTIAQSHTAHNTGSARTITLTDKFNTSAYSKPSKTTIKNNLIKFMGDSSILSVTTDSSGNYSVTSSVTPSNLISFYFALNYFIEKAIKKRAKSKNGSYYYSYELGNNISYDNKLAVTLLDKAGSNTLTEEKIIAIHNQIKNSNNAPFLPKSGDTKINTSHSTSTSSSSSSSSSSSCSSSAFIVYFNLK